MEKDLLQPVSNVKIVDRTLLKANSYNPNMVSEENMKLLEQSIITNGWTLPIVVNKDFTIIDGFHRWTVSGREPLYSMLKGKVPVVIVEHKDKDEDVYGTITHNRARGVHQLKPMEDIINGLIENGKSINEISKQLGMSYEEIFRLSNFGRDDFLKVLTEDHKEFSKGYKFKQLK